MKLMRILVIPLVTILMILLSAPLVHGQDLSKYRNFSFGMSLVELSKQAGSQPVHTKLIHKRPAVIQEATWWPRESSGSSFQAEPVWQVFFTLYNGELYRILVTYDRHATQGLTAEDMVQAISAQFGTATMPAAEISFSTNELYRSTEKVIARWENSQYSINLIRSRFLDSFALVMFSKRLDAQAEAAIAESVKLERREDPQKEIERQKREADSLAAARLKNRKTFHP
jgi:hypothetical protein